MNIKIFCDIADLNLIKKFHKTKIVKGYRIMKDCEIPSVKPKNKKLKNVFVFIISV